MKNSSSMLDKGINGVKWMSLSSVSTTVVNFILTVVLARLLSASDYGAFQAIAVLVGFADMLWSIGIGPALIRKKNLSEDDINTGHTINIILGLIIFGIINIAAPFWCEIFAIESQAMLRIYSFIFIINTFLAVPKSILYRAYRYNILAISSIAGILVHAALGIILAWSGWGAWSLIISSLAQYLIQIIFVIPQSGIKFRITLCRQSIKELIYFGGGYTLMQFFNYIALQGDNYIVNKFLGSEALGYYGKAYNLMGYPANLVGQTIDQVMYPILSEVQENIEKLKRIFTAETCFVGIVVAPITTVGVICSKELVLFLLGEEWGDVALPMAVMVSALFFRTAYKLNYTFLKTLGKVYAMSFIQFIYALTVIIGCYMGHFYGIVGVACGAYIAILVNYVVSLIVSIFQLQIDLKSVLFSYVAPIIYQVSLIMLAYWGHKIVIQYISNNFAILVIMTLGVFGICLVEYAVSYKYIVPDQTNKYIMKLWMTIRNKIKK